MMDVWSGDRVRNPSCFLYKVLPPGSDMAMDIKLMYARRLG